MQKRFLDFLNSPYHNVHKDIPRFVLLVIENKIAHSKEVFFKSLFPGKPYQERRIPDLMYKSLVLLEHFLGLEEYQNQLWNRKINLLRSVRILGLKELEGSVIHEISNLRASKTIHDSDSYYKEFLFESEADKIFLAQSTITEDNSLQNKSDQLDLFYLSAKLRECCEMMNRKNIVATEFKFHLLDLVMEAVETGMNRYAHHPAIMLYYRIMTMLQNPEDLNIFYNLKPEIRKNISSFEQDEQRSLYGFLQNYSIRKINSGKSEFYRELLDIYQFMMDAGLMDEKNRNLQWDLKNMVSIALRLGEYDWTLETIHRLKPYLPDESRDNAITYNLANYYYETKEYKKATRLLQSVEFNEVYYSLDSKSMLLKIYFEQEEEEAFYAHANAFNIWLKRNKLISKDNYTIYSNMVKYTRTIFAFKTALPFRQKLKKKSLSELKLKLDTNRHVANLSWLKREIELIL